MNLISSLFIFLNLISKKHNWNIENYYYFFLSPFFLYYHNTLACFKFYRAIPTTEKIFWISRLSPRWRFELHQLIRWSHSDHRWYITGIKDYSVGLSNVNFWQTNYSYCCVKILIVFLKNKHRKRVTTKTWIQRKTTFFIRKVETKNKMRLAAWQIILLLFHW